MELLRILAWVTVGWVVASFLSRRTCAARLAESLAPSRPLLSPTALRPLSSESNVTCLNERGRQRLATMCLREGKSLIYIAVCPWHTPTTDVNSCGQCFSWDVETGMAHCFWCGWGGRVARPLPGPIHPDLLPSTFRLVLVT